MPVDPDVLLQLGWDATLDQAFAHHAAPGREAARVGRVDRGLISVLAAAGERRASGAAAGDALAGGLAVGDWVVLEGDTVVAVLPRRSVLFRRAAAGAAREQAVAANLDVLALVLSLETPLRPRKLERMLAVAWSSGAQPLVVLSKSDVAADVGASVALAVNAAPGAQVVAVSTRSGAGMDALRAQLAPGRTVGLIGPSGAGKSTLINALANAALLATQTTRADGRGRHTTTHRQLVVLSGVAVLIDTPGMRTLGLWDADGGIALAFTDLATLAAGCRFSDCRHDAEPGCAVQQAITAQPGLGDRLASWRTLLHEQEGLHAMRRVSAQPPSRRATRGGRGRPRRPPP